MFGPDEKQGFDEGDDQKNRMTKWSMIGFERHKEETGRMESALIHGTPSYIPWLTQVLLLCVKCFTLDSKRFMWLLLFILTEAVSWGLLSKERKESKMLNRILAPKALWDDGMISTSGT